jgi:hypothetical protein
MIDMAYLRFYYRSQLSAGARRGQTDHVRICSSACSGATYSEVYSRERVVDRVKYTVPETYQISR